MGKDDSQNSVKSTVKEVGKLKKMTDTGACTTIKCILAYFIIRR
jgi:hypothetical protein